MYRFILTAVVLLTQQTVATPISNTASSLTFIYQNNLNASDDVNHRGAILLDPITAEEGREACGAISESVLPEAMLRAYEPDFVHSLAYLAFAGYEGSVQRYYIQDGIVTVTETGNFEIKPQNQFNERLPTLCTQSSLQNGPGNAVATTSNQIAIKSGGNTYVGFRNQKSFRFDGIPFASPPSRFEYSTVYDHTGQVINATSYGSDCAQEFDSGSAENCLYMNIQTPYIPKAGSKQNLRAVLVSIYGGGFTGGNSGANSGLDTGNMASRHDIVGVQFNYRLSTLGFLAIPGTDIRGNFGISDQVTALRWVRDNIAQFGGDPERITIIGESAGAGSVRALLGSPPVVEERLISGGVAQSNLGGGVTLGLDGDYGTTYSSYYTVAESYAIAGQQIFEGVGCNQSTISAQIACLKTVPWQNIVDLPTVARYVVIDGTYVNTKQLDVTNRNGSTAHVNVIFGTTANDGASFSTFPEDATSEAEGISTSLGISSQYAEDIINSGLFPFYNTGNLSLDAFNVSQRVATDKTFRCIDEATMYAGATTGAFASSYYYTMERTYEGYDPNGLCATGLCQGPVEPGYPFGDPNLPYFRLHGSDLGFTYGNQFPLRDADDLTASQLISGYFAQFSKTGNPNTPIEYLLVRGYSNTIESVQQSGPWDPVNSRTGPTKALDNIARTIDFPDMPQCDFLNYTISFYLDGDN